MKNAGKYFLSEDRIKGFTLIELMIAMAIATVVAMTGFALFSASNTSYKTQEGVGEAQQNARVAMDRIARDLRMAGFGLQPYSYPVKFGTDVGDPSFHQAITITDSSTGPDSITIVGVGYFAGTLVDGENTGTYAAAPQEYLCYQPNSAGDKFVNNDNKVRPERRFINVDGVFIAELDTIATAGTGSSECSSDKIKLPLTKSFTRDLHGGDVYIVQGIEYAISTTATGCSANRPCLVTKDHTMLRQNGWRVVAEGITDLQLAYAVDTNYDKKIDDVNLDTLYTSVDFRNSPLSPKYINAARVSVAAISSIRDKDQTFASPVLENHSGTSSPYRARVLTRVVKMRNPRPSSWLAP